MSKLPRPSVSRKSVLPSNRQSTTRPSVSRQSVSRPSVSRPSVSRPSNARGFSRPSIAPGGVKVDVKSNQNKNVKIILEFLLKNEYPTVITKKDILNPTEATFKSIYKFIMLDLEPKLDCQNIQKDIIDYMYDLGYPYPLKPSHFKPVGSPHSWPHLLEMLAWLCGLVSNMKYECSHMSQMWTLNLAEENADQELKHRVLASKYYWESQQMEGDVDFQELQKKYLREMNTDKVISVLEADCEREEKRLETLTQNNAKFPEVEADVKSKVEEVKRSLEQRTEDRGVTEKMLSDQVEKIDNLKEHLEKKREEKDTLVTEARRQEHEIAELEKVITAQPPQAQVQELKQQFNALTQQKAALQQELREIQIEDGEMEVLLTRKQAEFKTRGRQLLTQLQRIFPDAKYDTQGQITDRNIIQANCLESRLSDFILTEKREMAEMERELFALRDDAERQEDDKRIATESLLLAEKDAKQRETNWQFAKEQMIARSDKLSSDIESTDKSVAELMGQLREYDSPAAIEEKIALEQEKIRMLERANAVLIGRDTKREMRIMKNKMEQTYGVMVEVLKRYI